MADERSIPKFGTIRYEVGDAIATITLDRPDALNAPESTLDINCRA